MLRWVVDWRREWTGYELKVERIEDIGDQVLTIERNRATGKRSGVGVDMHTRLPWTLCAGKSSDGRDPGPRPRRSKPPG